MREPRLIPPKVLLVALPLAGIVSVAAGVAEDEELLTVGLAIFFVLVLVPLAAPFEGALLILATSWFPLDGVLSAERNLLAFAGGVNVSGLRLVGSVIGLAGALFLLRRRLAALDPPRWLKVGVILYAAACLWACVTLVWTVDFVDGTRAIAKLALPAMLAAVIVCNPRDLPGRALIARTCWVLGGALVLATVYGVLGVLDRDLLPSPETSEIADWFGWCGWTIFGIFAGIVGAVFFALAEHRVGLGSKDATGGKRYLVAWALAALALVQVPLTLKRIAVGAVGAAITAMVAFGGVRRLVAPLGLIAAVGLLLFFPPLVERNVWEAERTEAAPAGSAEKERTPAQESIDAIGDLAKSPTNVDEVIRLEGREHIWREAIQSLNGIDFVIGKGINEWASDNETLQGRGQLHGEPVRFLYETGAVGILLLAGAFGALLFGLIRAAVKTPRRTLPRALAEAAIGALVIYLLSSVTDNIFDYYYLGVYAWAALALAAVALATGDDRVAETATPAPA